MSSVALPREIQSGNLTQWLVAPQIELAGPSADGPIGNPRRSEAHVVRPHLGPTRVRPSPPPRPARSHKTLPQRNAEQRTLRGAFEPTGVLQIHEPKAGTDASDRPFVRAKLGSAMGNAAGRLASQREVPAGRRGPRSASLKTAPGSRHFGLKVIAKNHIQLSERKEGENAPRRKNWGALVNFKPTSSSVLPFEWNPKGPIFCFLITLPACNLVWVTADFGKFCKTHLYFIGCICS